MQNIVYACWYNERFTVDTSANFYDQINLCVLLYFAISVRKKKQTEIQKLMNNSFFFLVHEIFDFHRKTWERKIQRYFPYFRIKKLNNPKHTYSHQMCVCAGLCKFEIRKSKNQ